MNGFEAMSTPITKITAATTMKMIGPASFDTARTTREKKNAITPRPTAASPGYSIALIARARANSLNSRSEDAPSAQF